MYIKHYLSEHDVRCSSRMFPSPVCLLAGLCQASSHLSITRNWEQDTQEQAVSHIKIHENRNQEQAENLWLATYIDRGM